MTTQNNDNDVPKTQDLASLGFSQSITEHAPGAIDVEQAKAIEEVKAAMVVAKASPRNVNACVGEIVQACQRPLLAEAAMYEYPKGGTRITGPSIRLVEAIYQAWGNMKVGIRELARTEGISYAQAFAVDLQKNNWETIDFQVEHRIALKGGKMKTITDPREIYELVANYGQRRKRAAVLRLIPGDVVDIAVQEAQRTLEKAEGMNLEKNIPIMLKTFADEFNVTKEMIEKRIGHHADSISPTEMVSLKAVYRSLKDGMGKAFDHFDFGDQAATDAQEKARAMEQAATGGAKGKGKGKGKEKKKEPEKAAETPEQPLAEEDTEQISAEALVQSLRAATTTDRIDELEDACREMEPASRQKVKAAAADARGRLEDVSA